MKKKLVSVLLTVAMAATLLAGCGNSGTADAGTGDAVASTETGSAEDGETAHIIMTYLTTGTTPADLTMVQDAVNEISREKINVEVELKPVAIPDTFTNYSMWIASGEQMDLMCIAFQSIADYVNSGQLTELNDYLEADGAAINAYMDEFPLADGATINGEIYGVTPVQSAYGLRCGMIVRKDYFEETGYETKDQYTWEEMGEILSLIKENHPDTYPLCQLGSGVSATSSASGYYMEYDALGASVQSGVLLDPDSTEIVDLFETEEYHDFLLTIRDWYEKGYIMPDAATTDSLSTELLASERSSAYPMNLQPVQTSSTTNAYGWEAVALNMTEGYYNAASASSNTYWTVPVTSADPEAAVKFLNLIYEDEEVAHLLLNGIEGVHYEMTDEEGVIAFPEGVTMENSTYYNSLGLYGDRRNEYQWSASGSQAESDAWTENNMKRQYQSVGYYYDSSAMSNQLIAIGTVLDQYLPSLETGSVADVEGTYEQMISALKAAGIDEVIADNQAQFDEWLANNQ